MSATAPVSSTRPRTFSAHRGDAPGVHEHKCISVMRVLASAEQALCWPLWPVARPRPWVARRTHTPFSPRWAWPCGMVVQMEGTAPPETLREIIRSQEESEYSSVRSGAGTRFIQWRCLSQSTDAWFGQHCGRNPSDHWSRSPLKALSPSPAHPCLHTSVENSCARPSRVVAPHRPRSFRAVRARGVTRIFFSHRRRPSARMPWVEFTHRSAILRWLQRWLERSTAKMGTSEAGVCDLFPPRESNSVPDPRALAWCSLPPSRLRW